MSLEGRLEDLGLSDIFQIINLSKRSGVLTLVRKEGTARLVFSHGQIIFASSDVQTRLGYTLVKKSLITNDDLEYALRVKKGRGSEKPLGTILVEMGAIEEGTIEKEIRDHITLIVQDLIGWETGVFHFELGPPLTDEVVLKTGLSTEFLLLEATRLKDEKNRAPAPVEVSPRPAEPQQPAVYDKKEADLSEPSEAKLPQFDNPAKAMALLTSMISELSGPSTSSEITLLVLRFASEIMNRAVILLVRKDEVAGLGQFGLALPEGSAQEQVRSIRIPLGEPSVFKDVVEKKMIYKSQLPQSQWHKYFTDKLGKDWPTEVFLAPLICENRAIALLYGDNIPGKEKIGDTTALEAFIQVAGVAFGKAILERRLQDSEPSKG